MLKLFVPGNMDENTSYDEATTSLKIIYNHPECAARLEYEEEEDDVMDVFCPEISKSLNL